jgi:hypothetical protein
MRQGRLPELLTTKALTSDTAATMNPVLIACTRGLALFLLAICPFARATTHRVHPGQGSSVIQRLIDGASSGDTVSFDAGTYPITSTLTLKCGLTYTGPVATPATAEITTSTRDISLTAMTGGCTSGKTTIEYLHFNGAGPLYVDTSGYSDIVFAHNQVTAIPYSPSCPGACTSLFFNGNNNNTDSNIIIEYNTFGDVNSCTAGFSVAEGECAGVLFNVVGFLTNLTVKYNTFFHLNEGMHFRQVEWTATPGATDATCNNCDIEYNYFNAINRIALEDQVSVVGKPTIISNNVFGNPLGGTSYAGMAISAPCCVTGRLISTATTTVPSNYIQNNVIVNSSGNNTTIALPVGIEMTGTGTQTTHNVVQGYVCYGVVWSGYSSNTWAILNNTIQGPIMASGSANKSCLGGYAFFISNECGNKCGAAPVQSGNITGATPAAFTSVAPTISPSPGAQSFPLAVTLTDAGYTSGNQPLGNTGIWYTTDGSNPVPGSGTAQYIASGSAFVLPAPATVKAVGMWGRPPQPTSYPAGYGFVPSAVKSAQYTSGVASQQRQAR